MNTERTQQDKMETERILETVLEIAETIVCTLASAAAGFAAVLTLAWFALESTLATTTHEAIPVSALIEIVTYVKPLSIIGACICALLYLAYTIGKMHGRKSDKTEVTEWKS